MMYPWLSLAQAVCLVLGGGAFGIMGWLFIRYKKGRLEIDAASEIHR